MCWCLFTSCCCCRRAAEGPDGSAPPEPSGPAPAASPALTAASAPAVLAMVQGSDDSKILKLQKPLKLEGSPSSLLEAAVQRLSDAEASAASAAADADAAAHAGLALQFVEAYMAAVREANTRFLSSAPALLATLAPDVALSQEGRATAGRDAVVRRLERGVETLVKLGGPGGEAPTYTLSSPRPAEGKPGKQVIECSLRRGSHRMLLVLEFGLKAGKISSMDFSRGSPKA